MISFSTTRPQALLDSFKEAIEEGSITTWEEDAEGDFTHKARQWRERAWMRPAVNPGTSLDFQIVFAKDEPDRRLVYSYYTCHLIEAFINHFHTKFTEACATPDV